MNEKEQQKSPDIMHFGSAGKGMSFASVLSGMPNGLLNDFKPADPTGKSNKEAGE